jgi:SAM-dependent methyltransferase
MHPSATGHIYDQLAGTWEKDTSPSYGIPYLERAIHITKNRGTALDIGCGSQGRMIDLLLRHGFHPEGLDVSAEMIALARKQHPTVAFQQTDICQWTFPKKYDLISAWDSTWHLPLDQQEPVLRKICDGLNLGGVYLFTTVGFDAPCEVTAQSCWGVDLPYSTLGIPKLLELLTQCGCVCRHLEYDQHPEKHLVVIAQKL